MGTHLQLRASDNINYVDVNAANPVPVSSSPAPSSANTVANAPVSSAALESSHILKASAGNLYGAYCTTGAVAGFFMIFDSATVPADGAVTPIHCIQAPVNTSVSFDPGAAPESYVNGIVVVFSTTGPFTKTANSATAFFHGNVQ